MPHITIQLYPGRSETQKARLVEQIVEDVVATLEVGKDAVSVAIEEVSTEDWSEKVYQKEIQGNLEQLYKKPGYRM